MASRLKTPTILTFTRYYLPGFLGGGPIRTLSNMVECLGDDFQFRIVAMDRDHGDIDSYPGMPVERWTTIGKANVYYVSSKGRSVFQLAKVMRETPHSVLYLNSFFDPVFTLRPLLCRHLGLAPDGPLVIAPRGEFSCGALSIKHWKKKPYIALIRWFGLCNGAVWQASSEFEKADIERVGPADPHLVEKNLVIVAADIAGQPGAGRSVARDVTGEMATERIGEQVRSVSPSAHANRIAGEPLRLCFLSRISPMKNLDYALQVLSEVRTAVRFSIYGPREDHAYWQKCERLIATLPSHVKAVYCGIVDPNNVIATLAQHEVFFLPTQGENFGHAVLEALCAGIPVLLSDKTPWRDLEQKGVGWALPLSNPSSFARVLDEIQGWDDVRMSAVRNAAKEYASEVRADPVSMEANQELFLRVIAMGKSYD